MNRKAALADEPHVPLARRRAVVLAAGALAFVSALSIAWLAIGLVSKGRANWLPVKEVRFGGEFKRVEPDSLRRIGAAVQSMGGSLLTLDLQQVRLAVLDVEWVRDAVIARRLPGTLLIEVREHEPFAYWESVDSADEDEQLLSTTGEVFSAALEVPLPHLAGPRSAAKEVMENFMAYREQARAAGLEVIGARLSARRAWQLTLANGATLELGRTDGKARLGRFLAVQGAVPALREPNRRIDLRYANGIAVNQPLAERSRSAAVAKRPS
jgi:cell division protein FtsQ